ncbi:hypothetical protein [Streptomyces griseochromogenes]|uniref:hypothetical protein n=1 Tax=Streptomyces griseochromogenes TaxID=68214 RepID=UPI0037BD7171
MNESLTLDGLSAPLRALRRLAVDFGHLPAPMVDVTTVYPDRLKLAFHYDLADFETWREALDIAPDAVAHATQGPGGGTRVLSASVEYAGAVLELVAYADITDPAPSGAAG